MQRSGQHRIQGARGKPVRLRQEIRCGIIHQDIGRAFGKDSIKHCLHRRRIANIAAMHGDISARNFRA